MGIFIDFINHMKLLMADNRSFLKLKYGEKDFLRSYIILEEFLRDRVLPSYDNVVSEFRSFNSAGNKEEYKNKIENTGKKLYDIWSDSHTEYILFCKENNLPIVALQMDKKFVSEVLKYVLSIRMEKTRELDDFLKGRSN